MANPQMLAHLIQKAWQMVVRYAVIDAGVIHTPSLVSDNAYSLS